MTIKMPLKLDENDVETIFVSTNPDHNLNEVEEDKTDVYADDYFSYCQILKRTA